VAQADSNKSEDEARQDRRSNGNFMVFLLWRGSSDEKNERRNRRINAD